MADLAKILVSLTCVPEHSSNDIYPRCLSAAGRRVSEAGIDGLAVRLTNATREALRADESLRVMEAKHTARDDIDGPLDGLDADIQKTTDERLRDFLRLLISHLRAENRHPYAERAARFMEGNTNMTLTALVDPELINVDYAASRARTRFDSRTTPSGIPVRRFLLASIPDLETWTASTL
jgi:hypothetical protein